MEGKFRRRSSAVWCPKPRDGKKVTGWTNWAKCMSCPSMEEFHLDNEGVFCLYPKIKI